MNKHTSEVKRTALRWHGGKWILAPWIIAHFSAHRIYVEPFGGAMSVLLRKPRSYAEVYNDLDVDVVNFFRVLRSDDASKLRMLLFHTPFSRTEFEDSYATCNDAVERARRLVIRSFMGFGSNGHSRVTGFRSNSNRSGSTPAHDWANYSELLGFLIERLVGVVIENRDACEVMLQQDGENTLHYVDPPYVFSSRADFSKDYAHEMDDASHQSLLETLKGLKGKVVLSGYDSKLYNDALGGWHRVEKEARADGAKKRVEVLWLNHKASASLNDGAML